MKSLLTMSVLLAGCMVTPAAGPDTFGSLTGDDTGTVPPPDDDGEEAGESSSDGGVVDPSTSTSTSAGSSGGGSTDGASTGHDPDSGGTSDSADGSSTGPGVIDGLPEYSAVCSEGVLSTHGGDSLDDPELIIVGVYQATNTDIDVSLDRPGPGVILVLSSYEPVHWVLDVAAGTDLQEVILNGYEEQTVEGEGAATVTDRSGIGSYIEACGYAYPDDGGGCETGSLISGAESLTGADLTGFGGCYSASAFTVD